VGSAWLVADDNFLKPAIGIPVMGISEFFCFTRHGFFFLNALKTDWHDSCRPNAVSAVSGVSAPVRVR
jgi:hypothetical protein